MTELNSFLQKSAPKGLLPLAYQLEAAERFSMHLAKVEDVALSNNILPVRYQRNRAMISTPQQLSLLRSKVVVVGCGGLGGYIIEELARLGVGNLVVVDPDIFEEHNLNRQLFCTTEQLGRKKVNGVVDRLGEINPAVRVRVVDQAFGHANGEVVLQGSSVVADALDSISSRLELADACCKQGIPLVHGAIAGWSGHVAVQYPGEDIFRYIYGSQKKEQGVETRMGNPSFTPAVIASIQVAEVIKILLNQVIAQPRKYWAIDLYHSEFLEIPIPEQGTHCARSSPEKEK